MKNPRYWTEGTCKHCQKVFDVRIGEIKRGKGKFCSVSCSTKFRNLLDNPSKRPDVRQKISQNHADVSGFKNPMYGRRGKLAPSYIDGRNKIKGETYKKIAFVNLANTCSLCGEQEKNKLNVHHKDGNRKNNKLNNLVILCSKCHMNKAHTYIRNTLGQFVGSKLNKGVV